MQSIWTEASIGFAAAFVLSVVAIRWVGPLGWMDCPDQTRKKHSKPVARTAGLVLWALLLFLHATGRGPFPLDSMEWAGVHLMAAVGLLDDRFNLRPRYKALAGFAVSLLLAWHAAWTLGGGVEEVSFLGMSLPNHPILTVPILSLWFWAMPQAYNLIDGINGLSMGFAALLFGVLGWSLGAQSALLWGGLAALLLMNFPKAHHFLGDCGALMLGTFFSLLAVKAFAFRDPNLLLWVFAYPTVDVTMVVGIRKWKGLPLSGADRSHLHHWMMDRFEGRAWMATPALLGIAGLPMMRATAIPGNEVVSALGLGLLLLLAFRVFRDRVTAANEASAQVRREIPFMTSASVRDVSGSHPRL